MQVFYILVQLLFLWRDFSRIAVIQKCLFPLQRNTFFLHLVENRRCAFDVMSVHRLLIDQAFFVHLICLKLYICNF